MHKKFLSRRTLLKSAAVSAFAAPFLRRLELHAQEATAPKRLVVVVTPNGVVPDEWFPSGGELDFAFKRSLAPLEEHRQDLIVLDGLNMDSFDSGPHNIHGGNIHMLTGVEALDCGSPGCNGGQAGSDAGGISVDQYIVQQIKGDTAFPSGLQLGVRCDGSGPNDTVSFTGPKSGLPVMGNPFTAFDRVFQGFQEQPSGPSPEELRRNAVRRSVLDHTVADFAALRGNLGAEDRVRLDEDLESFREVENQFLGTVKAGAGCSKPTLGDPIAIDDPANVPAVTRLQMDLLTATLACDLTRVATLCLYRTGGGADPLRWLGYDDRHHDLAHSTDKPDGSAGEKLVTLNRYWAEQYAYLLTKLKSVPEGSGTLLDNTVVLFANSLSNGSTHSGRRLPWVLAGKAGGALRTGRYVKFSDRPHNDLLVTLCQALGVETNTFGDPRFCSGPLTELFA
jgi:hypothetical protein